MSCVLQYVKRVYDNDEDLLGLVAPPSTRPVSPGVMAAAYTHMAASDEDDLNLEAAKAWVKPLIRGITMMVHQINWQQKQLMSDIRADNLKDKGTKYGPGKNKLPAYVTLLPKHMQAYDPTEAAPENISTNQKLDSAHGKAVRDQRDAILKEVKHLWEDQGLTWNKLDDEVKARITQRMFAKPACWGWSHTAARFLNYVANWRRLPKSGARSKDTTPQKGAAPKATPSTPRQTITIDDDTKGKVYLNVHNTHTHNTHCPQTCRHKVIHAPSCLHNMSTFSFYVALHARCESLGRARTLIHILGRARTPRSPSLWWS